MAAIINFFAQHVLLCVASLSFLGLFEKLSGYRKKILLLNCAIISLCFLLHVSNFLLENYQVMNVFFNSSSLKNPLYKIAGSWGSHEGSMLLWLFLLHIILLLSVFKLNQDFAAAYLKIAFLFTGFYSFFVYGTSNPFLQFANSIPEGMGLNPILQDVALSIHPPILYFGYVATIPIFCFSICFMEKNNPRLLKNIQSWIYISFSFLSLGIGLGSWWAYRTLGWGGYWFFDPVENASLLPWLMLLSAIHYNYLYRKKSLFLGGFMLCCLFSCYATLLTFFLVRSGVLVSVHSFAADPSKGAFLLLFLCCMIMFGFYRFDKANLPRNKNYSYKFISRENFLNLGMLGIIVAFTTIVVAEVFPPFLKLYNGQTISVGEPYYVKTFMPLIIFSIVMMNFALAFNMQKDSFRSLIDKHAFEIIAAILSVIALIRYTMIDSIYFLLIIFVALNLFFMNMRKLFTDKTKLSALAHISAAILIFSVTINVAFDKQQIIFIDKNNATQFYDIDLEYKKDSYDLSGDIYTNVAEINLSNERGEIGSLYPEIRYHKTEAQKVVRPAILSNFLADYYFSANEISDEQIYGILYFKPMISWIWFSLLLMALSGIYGLVIINKKVK